MKKRIISAIVMILIVVPLLILGGLYLKIGTVILGACSMYELLKVKNNMPLFIKIISIISVMLLIYFSNNFDIFSNLYFFPALFLLFFVPVVFIDNKEMKERPRVGEVVTARVTYVRKDGRLNASLREVKEKALLSDAQKILDLLQERKGKMPYSDGTSPEVIRDKFQISKAAFKRALGHLLREGLVEEKDGWTYLQEK